MNIMQGDQYNIELDLTLGTEKLTGWSVEKMAAKFGAFTKNFPGEIEWSAEIGVFLVPFTQEETAALSAAAVIPEVRVKLNSGDVIGAKLPLIRIYPSTERTVL